MKTWKIPVVWQEMAVIKAKISKANTGRNNGMSKQLKIKSIKTDEEYHFDTLIELMKFFNLKGKGIIAKANRQDNTLFRKEWLVAYENEDYQNYNMPNEHSRGTKVKLTNIDTNEEIIFGSRNALYRYLNLDKRLEFKTKIIQYKNYILELLN